MAEINKNGTTEASVGQGCSVEEAQVAKETFKEEEKMAETNKKKGSKKRNAQEGSIAKVNTTEAAAGQECCMAEAQVAEGTAVQECGVVEIQATEAGTDQVCEMAEAQTAEAAAAQVCDVEDTQTVKEIIEKKEEAKIKHTGDWVAIEGYVLGVGDTLVPISDFLAEYPELKPIMEDVQKRAMKYPMMKLNEYCMHNLFSCKGYHVSNAGYIRYVTDKLKVKGVGKAFRVSGLIKNADTGHYSVTLEIFNPYDGVRRLEGVSISINAKGLETLLCDNGCIVTDAKLTHGYFREQTDFAMKGYTQRPVYVVGKEGAVIEMVWGVVLGDIPMLSTVHSERIGWDIDRDTKKMVFKGKTIYTADNTFSDYQGNFMIGEQGDYEVYVDMLKKEVIGNVSLETTLSFASSATLLKFMNETFGLNLLNPIVHMYGDSTSGKTTALILMVSFGGNPVRSEDASMETLFTTFNGTADSLLKVIGNNNGFLFGIDELSMSKMSAKEKERILYALTGGLDKKRLLRDGSGLQRGVSFATTILTNGEETIVPHNGVKQGFFNRVFEFACIAWTKSAENANEIQTVCKKNYGFVTPMLAQYLLRLDEAQRNQLLEHYNEWKQKFIDRAKAEYVYDQYTERLSETLALFMVSLECFGAVTGLGLHYDEVFGFLFNNILVKEGK